MKLARICSIVGPAARMFKPSKPGNEVYRCVLAAGGEDEKSGATQKLLFENFLRRANWRAS